MSYKQWQMWYWLLITVMTASCLSACKQDREEPCHLAVRSLSAAPTKAADGELAKVVAFGKLALPEIEQAYHGAGLEVKLRLLTAIERINDPTALPFLDFVSRQDLDEQVKQRAREVAANVHRQQH